jgi:tetratricopeptide (TPR) repeat protein
LYPDFAFTYFGTAMVHVARNHLSRAEAVLRDGLAIQARQLEHHTRFPALGLHWLLGLVRLAQDDVPGAIEQLDDEVELADPERLLYGREYRIHALHGRGLALLRIGRIDEAVASIARALEVYPDYPPTRVAMARALRLGGDSLRAAAELGRVEEALAMLSRRRPYYAAIIEAAVMVEHERHEDAARRLLSLLGGAPPGFAAWTLPVEPLLRPLTQHATFTAVLHALSDRAR